MNQQMNVLDIIESDHQKLLDGIAQLEKGAEGSREDKFNVLMKENMDHMRAEESVFYPALESDIPDMVMKSLEAHNIARISMEDLASTPKEDPRWVAKLQVFRDVSCSHIEEEEGPVFDVARSAMSSDALQELGRRFLDAKGASAPRPPAAEASAGMGR